MLEVYDSTFQKNNEIDQRAIGHSALICTDKDEWISCRLGVLDKKLNQHQYWTYNSSLTKYSKLKWASILIAELNLRAMQTVIDVAFE